MPDEAKQQLAERLREAREYLGLSQEEVAQQMGMLRPAISQIENGNRRVDAIELGKFAKLYQRPVSFFTGEEAVGEAPQIEMLKRTAEELSDKDREEVLRFAEFLRARSSQDKSK
jgi:transcriptional regulator with XRE-family HTH domain